VSQLPLPLTLQDHAVFESFHSAGNEELLTYLQAQVESPITPGCYLWGAPASGKTHLLQAMCERAGDNSVYLPLGQLRDIGSSMLDGLASRGFVCIDDVHKVVGDAEWELGLFNLCNDVSDSGAVMVLSADRAPRELGLDLADLASRVARLTVFRCRELPEQERIPALQLRARHRGLNLPDDTASFLLSRSRRDMRNLYRVLDKLDVESLAAQRRLTIPFVREVLSRNGDI